MSTDKPSLLPSRTSVLEAVRVQLQQELELPDAALAEDEQLDLLPGADSVRLMRVAAALEKKYDVEADDNDLRAVDTVGQMADVIFAAITSEHT